MKCPECNTVWTGPCPHCPKCGWKHPDEVEQGLFCNAAACTQNDGKQHCTCYRVKELLAGKQHSTELQPEEVEDLREIVVWFDNTELTTVKKGIQIKWRDMLESIANRAG